MEKKMRIYCHLLVVSLIFEAALAANATAATSLSSAEGGSDGDAKKSSEADTKNKRQIDQFVGSPGASFSSSLGYDAEQSPQAYPLQSTHGIYNQQQRLPLYTRRPIAANSKSPVLPEDDVIEQERQLQSQQQQQFLSSYYNYGTGLNYDDNNDDRPSQIDSRNLPVEPRTKVETAYQNPAPAQRVAAIAYSPGTPKQNQNSAASGNGGQNQYTNNNNGEGDDDEYLDVIRNAELVKNSQHSQQASKAPYQSYATGSQTPSIDHQNYDYTTKSPFSSSEYKRYTATRSHISATPSAPVPNLQPQTSQQQFSIRQPSHYTAQPSKTYATAAGPSPDYLQTYDDDNKDTIRVNLKKYQDTTAKPKYDSARGQYHHEVSAKPTKKAENFRPSYRFESTPQVRLDSSNQQSVVHQQPFVQVHQHQPQPPQQQQQQQQSAQQQPLHYQSVQQISQNDPKLGQSQYSVVVPQQGQQAYFSPESNNPFQSFYPHNEQLIGGNFAQTTAAHLSTAAQQFDNSNNNNKQNAPSEFRIQYLNHGPPTPTPTPTPRGRFASDSTPGQPLKYELYDPSGSVNVAKDAPRIKLVAGPSHPQPPPPQHLHRPQFVDTPPQYYKKIKIAPAAHVQYVPIRQQQQYHQQNAPSAQPPLSPQASQHYRQAAASQGQSDILVPIQPSQNTLFVAPNTGQSESSGGEKSPQHHIAAGHEQRRPPLPITSPKKPITQAEFQALVDAGYKVQAIPVPVPVPVSSEKYKQLQYQPSQRGIGQPIGHNGGGGSSGGSGGGPPHSVPAHTRQASTHYIRYHPKQESEEGILTSYLKPLIDYIGGPSQ